MFDRDVYVEATTRSPDVLLRAVAYAMPALEIRSVAYHPIGTRRIVRPPLADNASSGHIRSERVTFAALTADPRPAE